MTSSIDRATYEQLLQHVDLPVLCCAHLGLLAQAFPGVSTDTICAIFAQENQYKVIKSHHIHKANMAAYCSRYLAGEDVLQLCAALDFPPCLLMRRMLELLLRLSKQRVSDVLKDPQLLAGMADRQFCLEGWFAAAQQQQQQQQQGGGSSSSGGGGADSSVATITSSSSSSSGEQQVAGLLARLQGDVVRCVHADRSYSPYCDMAKSLAGLEHEAKLCQLLRAAGVAFWSEQQLRERGLFKTPDALLQVPICVRCGAGADHRWHVVHWIDSKASFGDDRTHRQQLDGQYATYVNRYGPGLVIYWFGFISQLQDTDPDVALLPHFPPAHDMRQLPRITPPAGARRAAGTPAAVTAAAAAGAAGA